LKQSGSYWTGDCSRICVFRIEFAEITREHMRLFSANKRTKLLDVIARQLSHEPERETKKRLRLRPNPLAPWELRIAEFRVFYEVDRDHALV